MLNKKLLMKVSMYEQSFNNDRLQKYSTRYRLKIILKLVIKTPVN